jgi:hypothetical protein
VEVSYYEHGPHANVDIGFDDHNREISARRVERGVELSVRGSCEGIYAAIEVCLTCEEYERLLCELARIKCGHRVCCEEERIRLFDQDECDEREEPVRRKTNTTTKGGK